MKIEIGMVLAATKATRIGISNSLHLIRASDGVSRYTFLCYTCCKGLFREGGNGESEHLTNMYLRYIVFGNVNLHLYLSDIYKHGNRLNRCNVLPSVGHFLCSSIHGNKQLKGDVSIGWHIPFLDVSKA